MSFAVSPGVNVSEFDLTTIVPTISASTAAIAGIFNWGPVCERVAVDSETKLLSTFGKPNSNNAETWFTAASFLGYGNSLLVVRAANTTSGDSNAAYNAIGNVATANVANSVVANQIDFGNHAAFETNLLYIAKYPGALGNSLKVGVCDNINSYSSNVTSATPLAFSIGSNSAVSVWANATNTAANTFLNSFNIGDYLLVGNSTIGQQYVQVSASALTTNSTNTTVTLSLSDPYRLHTASNTTTIQRFWEFFNVVGTPPKQTEYVDAKNSNTSVIDGLHVVITDRLGGFTGVPGTILETYQNLSRATDSVTPGGQTNYYRTVLNNDSKYIWNVNDRTGAVSNTAVNLTSSTNDTPLAMNLAGGQDGASESVAPLATIASGYNLFASPEDVDVSLILQGKPIGGTTTSGGMTANNFQLADYIIDNITSTRLDCVAFVTPDDAIVTGNRGVEAQALVNWRNAVNRSSSYVVYDSGYKYMYDRYNDVYRYIPMNGDIAGLCARTDQVRDPWWSPAGFNRGQIKNIVKLRFNPKKLDRDTLYSNNINPVVSFPGEGIVLYGDKTGLSQPSAFDRINVRRLFIVLEKAIATASKFSLFEFNDAFTQSQFKNLVIPYLRTVQGRRGITDFLVVCDSTNNTPEVVDANQFIGDIYIKPARSINFIQLNFVAVRTGVAFSEVVGSF